MITLDGLHFQCVWFWSTSLKHFEHLILLISLNSMRYFLWMHWLLQPESRKHGKAETRWTQPSLLRVLSLEALFFFSPSFYFLKPSLTSLEVVLSSWKGMKTVLLFSVASSQVTHCISVSSGTSFSPFFLSYLSSLAPPPDLLLQSPFSPPTP